MNKLVTAMLSLILSACVSPSTVNAQCNPFTQDFRQCLEAQMQEEARVAAQNRLNLQAHKAMQAAAQTLSEITSGLEPKIVAQGNAQVMEAFAELLRLNAEIVVGLDIQGFPKDNFDGPRVGIEGLISNFREFRVRINANENATPICFLPRTIAESAVETVSKQSMILSEPSRYSPEDIVAIIRSTMTEQKEILGALHGYNTQVKRFVQERNASLGASVQINPFAEPMNTWNTYDRQIREFNAHSDAVCATKTFTAIQLLGMTRGALELLSFFVP